MATYYVRTDGNDGNTGLGPATAQAWRTIQKALGATGIASGDTVYIAPGRYNEFITVGMTSATATTYVIADVGATQFTGVTPGVVRLTAYATDAGAVTSTALITATSKNYLYWQGFYFEGSTTNNQILTCRYWTFDKCAFVSAGIGGGNFFTNSAGVPLDLTISKCVFVGSYGIWIRNTRHSSLYDMNVTVSDCLAIGRNSTFEPCVYLDATGSGSDGNGVEFYNCTLIGQSIYTSLVNSTFPTYITNCLAIQTSTFVTSSSTTSTILTNCRYPSSTVGNVTLVNSSSVGVTGVDFSLSTINNSLALAIPSPYNDSILLGAGTTGGAPASDIYGLSWSSNTDIGAFARQTLAGASLYIPTERNASTITIAPGSTSQSIELYLGATGLTASTSGLSAYYNRTRSADVQINLQARNITQNWTSGGFAEVNPNTMPGVYRLDIPNEALASGADDVTVVVRGASGTNGAVMSIKLSSGGLTTAQTASAVWNALTNDHTTHGTFGWNVLRADQDSKEGLVTLHQSGGVSRVDADVHAVANDTAAATALKGALIHDGTGYVDSDVVRISTSAAAANELEGALLHNGTDYIDSNLIGGAATRVFVGRFQMTQTGTTQGDIIEAFTTDTPAFELQLFDGDNNLVPVTGATLGLRILDVTSTVVETGTPTIEYGTGGIVRWTAPGTYLSIGCPAGMYRLFVDRTVSGTTTTFGPLQIKVQVQ